MAGHEDKGNLSQITVHMIGNAHIDPVWQWRWEEGRQEALDTCWAAIERLRETPAFIFCHSAAITYLWIEQEDPQLFEEIRRYVAEGRWCIVGGWWLEPDCNIPSGESFVRHGLYGQRYFLQRFGKAARTGWNVDSFGHAWQIPQILRGQGMEQYCFFRPGPHEKALPGDLFWWEAPDGSRVLAARMPGHYGTGPDEIVERIWDAARQTPPGLSDTMNFYGVGNHGGGPTRANIASILKVAADPDGPNAIFSTPDAFFDKVRHAAEFPVVSEELQYHARGCYTAVSALKQHNRRAENLLVQAEKLSCMARYLLGLEYPAADLEAAWKKVLFNQFHDILGGTSIRPACDDAIADYVEAETLAERAILQATSKISAQISCAGDGRPIVVYNTLSWQRQEVVEVEVTWPNHDDCVHIVNEDGRPVPFQIVHTNISGRGMTIRVAFLADLPPCGYRTYRMLQGPGPEQSCQFRAGQTYLESGLYRLEFDPATGYLTALLDKRMGVDLLAAPASVPLVIADPSDTWSHDVDAFRDVIGRFLAVEPPELVEIGPVRATFRVRMAYGASTLVQEMSLYQSVPRIDVSLKVDYRGQHEFLKLSFPTVAGEPTATYEGPYGFAVRPANGEEQPAHRWADLTGTFPGPSGPLTAGLAVLNDAKYGYDALGGELRMSVLRTPIYCFHDPAVKDPRRRYEYTDQGLQRFRYALLPHAGDWRDGDVVRQAQQLNAPPIAREEPAHRGKLPPSFSLASLDADNVILEVIKKAEDGEGLVLRAYEINGQPATAALTFAGQELSQLAFRPCEIKTLLLADGRLTETDMLERPKG
ncbi:MAG: glycosyl hydrolase-related protein [Armatimonadetes bacterium]|nr:glycosyl hydrolase-related protein [Armatimonadota bacterium]